MTPRKRIWDIWNFDLITRTRTPYFADLDVHEYPLGYDGRNLVFGLFREYGNPLHDVYVVPADLSAPATHLATSSGGNTRAVLSHDFVAFTDVNVPDTTLLYSLSDGTTCSIPTPGVYAPMISDDVLAWSTGAPYSGLA